jgi:diaminohydroxyphosphoribosylaminopyrimidine deaminase/5-amino-6-(5-phosphoribosylamino)uracil reductase
MSAEEDRARMETALRLARRGLGTTWPNPTVGCVIGRAGSILGRGWTQAGGRPHAERIALDDATARFGAESLRGATAWVTLEPCAHHGRTPPCADALVAAGIARVVAPITDPDPRVSGRGFAALRAAGLAVETGLMAEAARDLNAGFLSRQERGRPWVTLKLAATLDGRIATGSGESRWITGPPARARAHLMRAEHDAVLVGAGTARADDPMLDVRLPGLEDRRPIRIVADGGLSLSLTSRLAESATRQPVWLLHRHGADHERIAALEDLGIRCIETRVLESGELDMGAVMRDLADRGLTRVMCEGGGRLAASLLRARLVDELVWVSAGMALGDDGAPAVARMAVERLADAPRLDLVKLETLGADIAATWRPAEA